jgi:hypothetical protein
VALFKHAGIGMSPASPIKQAESWKVVRYCRVVDGFIRAVAVAPTSRFRSSLRPFGLSEHTDLSTLEFDSEPVAKYFNHVDADEHGTVSLFGIPLTPTALFGSVGVFCGVIALWMIPALVELRSANKRRCPPPQNWVLCFRTKGGGRLRRLLEIILSLSSFVFAIYPLIIVLTQFLLIVGFHPAWDVSNTALFLRFLGLSFSSVTFAVAGWELRCSRRIIDLV